MAKKINVDAVGVTVKVAHRGPGGDVNVGAQYTTDQGHAVVLEAAGYVTIDVVEEPVVVKQLKNK